MGVIEIAEIEDEFGARGNVEVGLDSLRGDVVQLGGAVEIEIVVGLGGGVESGGLEFGWGEIADAAIGNQDVAAGFNGGSKGRAVRVELEVGMVDDG